MTKNIKKAIKFGLLFEIVAICFLSSFLIFPYLGGSGDVRYFIYVLFAFIGILLNLPTIILLIVLTNFILPYSTHINDIVTLVGVYIIQTSFWTWIRYRYLEKQDQMSREPNDWISRIENRWK